VSGLPVQLSIQPCLGQTAKDLMTPSTAVGGGEKGHSVEHLHVSAVGTAAQVWTDASH
jgi:hypothetical protein